MQSDGCKEAQGKRLLGVAVGMGEERREPRVKVRACLFCFIHLSLHPSAN